MHNIVWKRSGGSFTVDQHDRSPWRLGLKYGKSILCCTRKGSRFDTVEVAQVAVRLEVQRVLG